jgi:hypothetical protein
VRGEADLEWTTHTVGYSGGPAGTVTSVTVSFAAARGAGAGTAHTELYDGAKLLGAGAERTLGNWACHADTFGPLSVLNANNLRTRIVFHNTAGSGALRYSAIWLHVITRAADAGADSAADSSLANDSSIAADSSSSSTDATATDAQTDASLQPTFPIRATFYYPWFPEGWNQQGLNPFTQYHPSLGYYDSSSATVIKSHIASMQYGKIQAAISSWWGQGTKTDSRVSTILSNTAGTGFHWTLYYEPEGTSDPSSSQIASDLSYIASRYVGDPSYLRVSGKPVIFVYADGNDACSMVDRWTQANTAGFYVVLKVFPGYTSCANQPQGWHQYAPANATDAQQPYSFTISPGFYKASESTPRLARNPAAWAQDIQAMVASGARFQLVTTFSEWGEGTAVESANEWATASGQGTYLDLLQTNGH